eukprot:scaffold561575_cov28-Prasinocladus_malaysianus.AAC.1
MQHAEAETIDEELTRTSNKVNCQRGNRMLAESIEIPIEGMRMAAAMYFVTYHPSTASLLR